MQSGIQKAQHQQPNFIYGGVRYNLQAGNWRQMKFKSNNDFQQYFLDLEELQYAIMKKSIFTFAPSTSNSTLGALYSYNFINEEVKQWKSDAQSHVPSLRRRYGLIPYEGRLCMFGGVHEGRYLNDLNSFCSYSDQWTGVLAENNTVRPSPRIPFVFCEVQNSNILLFGGTNENGPLRDAFLLVDRIWRQLKIINKEITQNKFLLEQIIRLDGIRYCSTKNGVYLFGGLIGGTYYNELYLMKPDYQNLTLKIQRVKSDTGSRPCPRAFHAMQKIGEASFAIYGGIHNNLNFRDLSVFDINNQKWTEIFPFNNPILLITQPKMYFELNSILLMGNISQKNIIKKGLYELRFPQFQIIKSEICSNCIKRIEFKQKQQLNTPKKPFVSNGLIYNMASQINFPFQAIALLLDCAEALKATQISITSEETNNKLTYFDIRFNGNNLTRQQYSSIISHSYLQDPIVMDIIDKIKLGSMRLGKTLIYIEVVGECRRVFLFSSDSLIISHYHELYAYFSYEQRISDQWLSTQESIMHKKFIMNLLRSYFTNPAILINSVKSHCFLIFESNVIMTSEKIYYGELISSQLDITQCKNNKKVQFLDNIGFKLSQQPEVSLGKYLQYLYLTPSIKQIKIQSSKIRTSTNKYLSQLQKLEAAQKIRSVCKQKLTIKTIEADCNLYEVVDPSVYIKQLKGIYVYYKGRLINRLDINFGDLFWQKFFKAKYRKAFGLWSHVGIINILKGLQPKSLRNQFKNQSYYSYFIREVRKDRLTKSITKPENMMEIQQQGFKPTKMTKRQKN